MSKIVLFHKDIENEFKKAGINGKFTIIKDTKEKNSKLLVSLCVFRMPDPYKDESMYIGGLTIFLDNFARLMPKCTLRIYYDDSVLMKDDRWEHLIEKAKTKPFTQILHYSFPQFKKPDSFYHEGVFGMIVRYFVLFNFGGVAETVMMDDIDYVSVEEMDTFYTNIKKALTLLEKSKSTFIFGTYGYRAYITKPRLLLSDITEKYDFNIRMVTQPSLCTKKLDKKILVDFMACVLSKCPIYEKWMSETISNMDCVHIHKDNEKRVQQCNYIKEIESKPVGVFMFGTDEFFLNGPMLEDFLKHKRPFLVHYEMPNMPHYHYALFLRFQKRQIPLRLMFDMYEFILGRKMQNVNDIYKAFKEVDAKIYKIDDTNKGVIKTPEAKAVCKKIYDFLQPRVKELLALKNLERFETQMFRFLENTKEEDFYVGRYFYEVTYQANNHYQFVYLG